MMIFIGYLAAYILMSLTTYILYATDKKRAIKNQYRIKERTLLLSSFLLGSLGGLLGMYHLRHKTKHWYFVVINYGSLIVHIAIAYWLYSNY